MADTTDNTSNATASTKAPLKVRTRFAPSPTGFLHIGGLRTCLYNYLFAKHHQGTFILRIEDTDQTRFVEGAAENLLKVLPIFGMESDEGPQLPTGNVTADPKLTHLQSKGDKGPYVQSQRTELYQEHAKKLIETGHAYYCFCTPEELDQMRAEQTAAKLPPMYDRRCLKLTPDQSKQKLDSGTPHVIRLKMPRDRKIEFKDHVRGKVSFLGGQIDDQVLLKSDGLPTYHLANVVDDHYMEISHVIRGEEWLSSTPKHLVMYDAFGWTPPEYAHLPLILNADKSKLSKRQNDVSVESYLERSYLPEALINFIVLLGWNPGKGSEQEIFSMADLIDQFTLEGVNKAGAVFNPEKLDWINHQWNRIKFFQKLDHEAIKLNSNVHINIATNQERTYKFDEDHLYSEFEKARAGLLLDLAPQLKGKPHFKNHPETFLKALLAIEENVLQTPATAWENMAYFFEPKPLNPELLTNQKMGVDTIDKAKESLRFCKAIIDDFSGMENLTQIKDIFLGKIKEAGRKNGEILWPLRAALTHQEFSVGAFESMWVLGKAETLKRLAEIDL